MTSENGKASADKFLADLSSLPQEEKNQLLGRIVSALLPVASPGRTEVANKEVNANCSVQPEGEFHDIMKFVTDRLCDGIIPDEERLVLSEVRKRINDAPSSAKCVPLICDQFEAFLEEVSTRHIMQSDLISSSSGNYFLVPTSVIEYINTTHANLRREHEDNQTATIERLKSMVMTPPDYSKRMIVKPHTAPAMAEFIAPENGYVMCSFRTQSKWILAEIDGNVIGSGAGDGIGWGPGNHYFATFPLRKGQKFIITTGDWHTVWFYPCLQL